MVSQILANILAEDLIQLPYITKSAGCVQTVEIHVKNKKSKKIPASTQVYISDDTQIECIKTETYNDLMPHSKEVGIIYFEDLNSRRQGHNAHRERWRGELKLVCWVQTGEACQQINTIETIDDIRLEVQQRVTGLINQDPIQLGRISVIEEFPKNPGPFDKYDYDEKERQYKIHPYEYFSLKVQYITYISTGCLT